MGLSSGWSAAALYGIALKNGDFRREYGVEIAKALSGSTEAFGQVRKDDLGDVSGAVGLRVRF